MAGWRDSSGDPFNASSGWHRDGLLMKTDTCGNMQWNRTYAGFDELAEVYSVIQTGDGGYAMAGRTFSFLTPPSSSTGLWLLKTDGNGDVLWNKTYGGPADMAYSLILTSDARAGICDLWNPHPEEKCNKEKKKGLTISV